MRQCEVYIGKRRAGVLEEIAPQDYVFKYDTDYYNDSSASAIALTLPKTKQEYRSRYLFPFFANMLSEGHNRQMQSKLLHIDMNDDFGILLATAQYDTIGAVTVKPIS